MSQDFSEEVKRKISLFKEKGFEFGKSEKYLSHRTGASFKEIQTELENCNNLIFTDKRNINDEERYTLYFVYQKIDANGARFLDAQSVTTH